MSVWFAIPSARPVDEAMKCLSVWQALGYRVGVFRDAGAEALPVDMCGYGNYKGYAKAVNMLAKEIIEADPEAEWIVTGGDDMYPDPNTPPDVIAEQCREHFGGTLGVMQPTGDRHMVDSKGRCAAERVCLSPWMGREWCLRAHEGRGPLWHGYKHEFVDEDLHNVALMLKLLWHRPDLTHRHDWWGRNGSVAPSHLRSKERWNAEGALLFQQRQAESFPESGLLP